MKKLILFLLLLPILATSQNEWLIGKTIENSRTYKARWLPDLGALRSDNISKVFYAMSKQNGIADNIQFAWLGEAATKTRVSGIYNYATKLYSTVGSNDGTQTTELSQPYLSGNIAPNERYCLNNPNGSSRYITHPTISFAANEAWSVTTVLNSNGSSGYQFYTGNNNDTESKLGFTITSNTLRIINSLAASYAFTAPNHKIIGKNIILTVSADGLGNLSYYLNGVFIQSLSVVTSFNFNSLIKCFAGNFNIYNGKIYAHIIRSGALSQSQITSEYNFFRSIYPEIETVKIGSQDWATSNLDVVCTPMGNVIPEITDNANVEKIENSEDRDFSSDTGFWTKGNAGITISGGLLIFSNVPIFATLSKTAILSIGKYYKITYTILNYVSGSIRFVDGVTFGTTRSANGTYTEYIKTQGTGIYIQSQGTTTLSVDNLSVQEIGWAGSTELYDGVYAQTSGTVEQKTYAAVKAAAMWCYYNNDAALGAIYGKLYNWYAAKLLQMDIDYYNTANPSTPWGYRVPTNTDFTTLQTTLGGSDVAGGKMKKEGLNYWNSPNTGADNSSGFSALGGGLRFESTGVVQSLNLFSSMLTQTSISATLSSLFANNYNDNTLSELSGGRDKRRGSSIRLIKQ